MERKKKPTYKQLFVNLLAELGWLISGTEQLKENMQEEVISLRICYTALQDIVEQYEQLYGQRLVKLDEEENDVHVQLG